MAERAARYRARNAAAILARAKERYDEDDTIREYRTKHRRMSRMVDRWIREWLSKEAA